MDSNPVALKAAQAAMKAASQEQGGTCPEGTSKDPHAQAKTPEYTGHDSAKGGGK